MTTTIPETFRPGRRAYKRVVNVQPRPYLMRVTDDRGRISPKGGVFCLSTAEVERLVQHYTVLTGSTRNRLILGNGQPSPDCTTHITPANWAPGPCFTYTKEDRP